MTNRKITILGAGISGMATAYWLSKEGFEVTILEAKSEPGGAMETVKENQFLIDFGPNSGLETTPLISKLAEEVGIRDEMIYANEEGDKRYILRDNTLHALPMGPVSLFKSNLFSTKGKLRIMCEPFIGKSEDGYYQSMAEFVTRRLGKEFLDYAIDPFVSGVSAGDPNMLSVKSAFPKLYRLEEVYGGLIKGMIRGARERKKSAEKSKQNAKMFSFRNGMQTFPLAIAEKLSGKVNCDCVVKEIKEADGKYKIRFERNGKPETLESDLVLSTIPAYALTELVENIDPTLTRHLKNVFYPKVMVLYLGFNKKDIGQPLDGFGYLIPSLEKKKYLGAIWSSTIFENRADEETASFTLFVGGAKDTNPLDNFSEELLQNIISEFKENMKITGEPVTIQHKTWNNAIPQYNIGYIEHEKYFSLFEKENPGFFLSGNYRGGISVGDCIKNSEIVKNRILEFVNRI